MVLSFALLSEFTKAWLLYLGLVFLLMVMYAPGGLSRAERELAATVVSRVNGCVYCGSVHAQRFEQLALQEPAVQQCYRVSPGPDFIVVLTVHDMPAYHRLADRLFTRHAGVRAVRTFFSVHRAKFSAHLPLPERA